MYNNFVIVLLLCWTFNHSQDWISLWAFGGYPTLLETTLIRFHCAAQLRMLRWGDHQRNVWRDFTLDNKRNVTFGCKIHRFPDFQTFDLHWPQIRCRSHRRMEWGNLSLRLRQSLFHPTREGNKMLLPHANHEQFRDFWSNAAWRISAKIDYNSVLYWTLFVWPYARVLILRYWSILI